MGNISEIEVLKNIIRETIIKVLYEVSNDRSLFPLYTAKEAARIFHVSTWTVRCWHKKGLLQGRYQILSGRSCRLMFSNSDLLSFWNEYFPRPEDFDAKHNDPHSTHAAQIQRLLAYRKIYARRRIPQHE